MRDGLSPDSQRTEHQAVAKNEEVSTTEGLPKKASLTTNSVLPWPLLSRQIHEPDALIQRFVHHFSVELTVSTAETPAEAAEETPEVEAPQAEAPKAVAQNLYEGVFLVESTKFANDPEKITNTILDLIQKAGGEVLAHAPFNDGKLAYPINGRRKGLHYLTYFKMAPAGQKELDRACKLNDLIMRKLIIRHPENLFNAMVQALTAPAAEAPA